MAKILPLGHPDLIDEQISEQAERMDNEFMCRMQSMTKQEWEKLLSDFEFLMLCVDRNYSYHYSREEILERTKAKQILELLRQEISSDLEPKQNQGEEKFCEVLRPEDLPF